MLPHRKRLAPIPARRIRARQSSRAAFCDWRKCAGGRRKFDANGAGRRSKTNAKTAASIANSPTATTGGGKHAGGRQAMVRNYHCAAQAPMRLGASIGFAASRSCDRLRCFSSYFSSANMRPVCDGFGAKAGFQPRRDIAERVAQIAKRDPPPLFVRFGFLATDSAVVLRSVRAVERHFVDLEVLPNAQRPDISVVRLARAGFQIFEAQIGRWSQRRFPEGGRVCGAPPQTIPLRHW